MMQQVSIMVEWRLVNELMGMMGSSGRLGCTKTDTDMDTDTTRVRKNANLKMAETGTRKW